MLSALTLGFVLSAASTPRIAVLNVRARAGVQPDIAEAISDAVVSEVRKRNAASQVIGEEDLRTVIQLHKQKASLGCADVGCLAEIGGALGAEQLVVPALARIGQSYLLSIRLVDVSHARVLREESERLTGQRDDALFDAVGRAVMSLFKVPPQAPLQAQQEVRPRVAQSVTEASVVTPPPEKNHTLAFVLGGVAVAAAGTAVTLAFVQPGFTNWKDQPAGTSIPQSVAQSRVNTANALVAGAIISAGVAAALGTGAALAW